MPAYTRSQLAQALLYLRGNPIRFDKHPYMTTMMDSTAMDKLYICSRQVGKSVNICVELLIDPITDDLPIQGLRELYVMPREKQAKQFSVEKLQPMIYGSDPYKEMYTDSSCRKDVFLYTFKDINGKEGHQIYLRAAYQSADAARGVPADKICIDEVQDILPSFLPDILSSSLASPYRKIMKCGTPKSEDNHIEKLWIDAQQHEWAVPCYAHSPVFWNIPLGVENIGPKSVVCSKCKKPINPLEGIWVMTKACTTEDYTEGFHINQLAAELNMTEEKWKYNILGPYGKWTEDKFNNEVLGVSSGKAQQLITEEEMRACLAQPTPLFAMDRNYDDPPRRDVQWFAGVDWGEGRDDGTIVNGKKRYSSFTIFFIGTYDMYGKLNIAHYKKFRGNEASPLFIVDYIVKKMNQWNIVKLAADYGHGWGVIEQVIRGLGGNQRVFTICESATLVKLMQFDAPANRYTINRNEFIARLANAIKRQEINFPKGTEDCFKDFLAERTEFSEEGRKMMYIHRVDEPDDALHALMYLKIAADLQQGRLSVPI